MATCAACSRDFGINAPFVVTQFHAGDQVPTTHVVCSAKCVRDIGIDLDHSNPVPAVAP